VLVETDGLIGLRSSHFDLSGGGGSLPLVVICTRLLLLLLAILALILFLAFLLLAFLLLAPLLVALLHFILGCYNRSRCSAIDGHPQLILIRVERFRPVSPRCPSLRGRCSRRCSRRRLRAHRRPRTKTVFRGSGR